MNTMWQASLNNVAISKKSFLNNVVKRAAHWVNFHCFCKCKIVQSYIRFEPFTSRSSALCTLKTLMSWYKPSHLLPAFFFHLFEAIRPGRWAEGWKRERFCHSSLAATPALRDHLARPSISEVPSGPYDRSRRREVSMSTLWGLFSKTSARVERGEKRDDGETERRGIPVKKRFWKS